jgi:hypothetical protein
MCSILGNPVSGILFFIAYAFVVSAINTRLKNTFQLKSSKTQSEALFEEGEDIIQEHMLSAFRTPFGQWGKKHFTLVGYYLAVCEASAVFGYLYVFGC